MVYCFRPFGAEHTDQNTLSLEAFLKPEVEKITDPTTALGEQ